MVSNFVGTDYVFYERSGQCDRRRKAKIDILKEERGAVIYVSVLLLSTSESLLVEHKHTRLQRSKTNESYSTELVTSGECIWSFSCWSLQLQPKKVGDLDTVYDDQQHVSDWFNRWNSTLIELLENKMPVWTGENYALRFHANRVLKASVKNFQLIASSTDGQEQMVLQFGRATANTFALDFRQPLSLFQAFSICLTSFDTPM